MDFYSLECRLNLDASLKSMYINFINEYINLNSMLEQSESKCKRFEYFLPRSSSTTKLGVVLDGSQRTDDSLALNDVKLLKRFRL